MSTSEHYQQGMAAYVAGQYGRALQSLGSAATEPGQAALIARYFLSKVHHRLGCDSLAQGQHVRAASHFRAASVLACDHTDLAGYLAACYLGERSFEAASHQLEQMLMADADSVETRIRLALTYHKSGEPLRAIATLRQGVQRRPDDAQLHYQLGVVTAATGDIAGAQPHFEAALSRDPAHAQALERLAQCCGVEGRPERALRYLERAHRIEPENARIAWQLTLAAPEQAARLLSIAPPARTTLDERALERLAQAILEEPDCVDAFVALPPSAADPELFLTLAATLRKALEKHPDYADLRYRCGVVYQRLGRSPEAINQAERALVINPRYVNALLLLAQLYAQMDRRADAVARLEAAIQAGGDYPDVHYLLGRLCQQMGSTECARSSYRRALELNAEYQEAREALAALAA